ncbi:MAG: hypothetical protein VYE73_10230 [Acidobacteriota bacterium]|nr:hypothetical protein [Acidobacteriota bacterium]
MMEAFNEVTHGDDPLAYPVVIGVPPTQGRGRVEFVSAAPDRLIVQVSSEGGTLAVRRSYNPIWRARTADGSEDLEIRQLNLVLLGVTVLAGAHEVVIDVDPTVDRIATVFAILALAGCLALAVSRRRRQPRMRPRELSDL